MMGGPARCEHLVVVFPEFSSAAVPLLYGVLIRWRLLVFSVVNSLLALSCTCSVTFLCMACYFTKREHSCYWKMRLRGVVVMQLNHFHDYSIGMVDFGLPCSICGYEI